MAKTSIIVRHQKKKKFEVREYNRCPICGRSRGYLRRFDMCRICFRKLASGAQIPGVVKSSW
ncbi:MULTISPECIES: type Z 30S ribosomal protein S14 [Leptospira]|uniref:Small ribosomal subunit protein uS14 n=2 Tax=Leptospira TaxID=171 RepID=A0A2M9YRJ2_9LEPT|nr:MULTISPECIES: type Z 30S ribosomal protein S14 [Leptospira]PJZ54109.1 type Z 30S ribosomal protein S14 [Leptospira adleri]PJZ62711.1 type Z 30S ribosomal protein S14 [Leptospira adleri]RHX88424.1 type Z 30S ribosomal protein S14 [Leptospira stimsonii]RHX92829.1 type Z 30S ribosomal protein S14 [Leptospira stimsonii]TGK22091.1 type Z 30S ribosomal protein S14 [Leptospira stimsonii]